MREFGFAFQFFAIVAEWKINKRLIVDLNPFGCCVNAWIMFIVVARKIWTEKQLTSMHSMFESRWTEQSNFCGSSSTWPSRMLTINWNRSRWPTSEAKVTSGDSHKTIYNEKKRSSHPFALCGGSYAEQVRVSADGAPRPQQHCCKTSSVHNGGVTRSPQTRPAEKPKIKFWYIRILADRLRRRGTELCAQTSLSERRLGSTGPDIKSYVKYFVPREQRESAESFRWISWSWVGHLSGSATIRTKYAYSCFRLQSW